MTQHQARHHPVATFLFVLVISPYLFAAALLVGALYATGVLFRAAFGSRP